MHLSRALPRAVRTATVCALAGLLLTASGCAPVTQQIETRITNGDAVGAVTIGDAWLADHVGDADEAERIVEVRLLVARARLQQAEQANTVEAYQQFRRRHASVALYRDLVARAHAHEASVFYRTATQTADTLDSYRLFCARYPSAAEVPQARTQEVKKAFDEASRIGELARWHTFIETYEAWPEAADPLSLARAAAARIAFDDARAAGSEAAWEAFQARYGDWPEGRELIREARRSQAQAAFDGAAAAATRPGWVGFITAYADWPEADALLVTARQSEARIALTEAATVEQLRQFRATYGDRVESSAIVEEAREQEAAAVWKSLGPRKQERIARDFIDAYPLTRAAAAAWNIYERHGALTVGGDSPDELATRVTASTVKGDQLNVFLQVLNEHGDAVGGLQRSHFEAAFAGTSLELVDFRGMEHARPVDFVFVFDTTGSMAGEIEGAKAAALEFAASLGMRNRAARYGLVTFGDRVRFTSPGRNGMTPRADVFRGWVSSQKAEGGGDTPENALDALAAAAAFRFADGAQPVFLLITDAPPHSGDRVTRRTELEVAQLLRARGICLFAIGPNLPAYRLLTEMTGGEVLTGSRSEFSDAVMRVANLTAKQYELVYRFGAGPRGDRPETAPRVHVRRDYSWTEVDKVRGTSVRALVAAGSATFLFACSDGLWRRDESAGWQKVSDLPFTGLWRVHGTGLLALDATGQLHRSADDGHTWRSVLQGGSVGQVRIGGGDGKHVLMVQAGVLWRSVDGGETFTKVGLPQGVGRVTTVLVGAGTDAFWILTEDGAAWATSNTGRSWRAVPVTPPQPDAPFTSLSLWQDSLQPAVTFALAQDGRLWRSFDRCRSWRAVSPPGADGGANLPVLRLVFDSSPRRWLIALTPAGPRVSSDRGLHWRRLDDGLAPDAVDDLLIAADSAGRLVVARSSSSELSMLFPIADREIVASSIHFAPGSRAVNPNLQKYLARLARHLASNKKLLVRVDGHTDDVGDEAKNLELARERARTVREWLLALGVAEERVMVFAFGEQRPRFPNTTEKFRAGNRRVELTLLERPRVLAHR